MTENKNIMDTGGEQPPKGTTPEGEVPVAPQPIDPAERPAAPETDAGVVGDYEPTAVGESPTTETDIFLNSLLEDASGERKKVLEDAINTLHTKPSTPTQLASALNAISFPPDMPDELYEKILTEAGQDPITVNDVMKLKSDWKTDESKTGGEQLTEEEQQVVQQMAAETGEMTEEMKGAMSKINNLGPEATQDQISDAIIDSEVVMGRFRKKYQEWDEINPGLANKVRRISRWGVGGALLIGIVYLVMLNAVTSGAAKRVAK